MNTYAILILCALSINGLSEALYLNKYHITSALQPSSDFEASEMSSMPTDIHKRHKRCKFIDDILYKVGKTLGSIKRGMHEAVHPISTAPVNLYDPNYDYGSPNYRYGSNYRPAYEPNYGHHYGPNYGPNYGRAYEPNHGRDNERDNNSQDFIHPPDQGNGAKNNPEGSGDSSIKFQYRFPYNQ